MADDRWEPTRDSTPTEVGERVDWIAPSGEVVLGGRYERGLWFLPGGRMYVYYTPTFWRPAQAEVS
jgi:hypothetical protein